MGLSCNTRSHHSIRLVLQNLVSSTLTNQPRDQAKKPHSERGTVSFFTADYQNTRTQQEGSSLVHHYYPIIVLPARGTADLFCLPELVVDHDGTLCVACLEMASMNSPCYVPANLETGSPKRFRALWAALIEH